MVFNDLALVYLAHYGHTLDVTYRHVLQQLLAGASTEPRRGARSSVCGHVELVVELMSHIFAQPSLAPLSTNALPSVFLILQSAMKMLCVELQTSGGALEGGFREFATTHAALSRNTFVLLVPPPLPAEAEDEAEEEETEEVFEEEFAAGPAVSSASTAGGGQFNGFDDDLLGGWSSASAVLQPTIAARPAMTAAASVSLLDTEDMWIFDAPMVPEKSAKVSMTASIKAGALDFFGQSSQPLVPSSATSNNKQVTAAGDAFAPTVLPAAEPEAPRKPIILFRDIYDEDEPFSATPAVPQPVQGSESDAFAPSDAPFSPTVGGVFEATPTIASPPAFATASTPTSTGTSSLDWPAGNSSHTGDGFDFSATAAPALDGWGGVDTAHSTRAPHPVDDGFAPTTASFPSATTAGASATAWPSGEMGLGAANFQPSAGHSSTPFADDGFGDMSAFGSSPAASAKTAPGVTRRSSFGPTGTAALSPEEVSALAAAKRASRRASVGASATQSKRAADPFFSQGALVPSPGSAGSTAPSKAADGWPGVATADGFPPVMANDSGAWSSDGFASSDVFASSAPSGGSSSSAPDDGFSATPADFVATAPSAPAGAGYYEGYNSSAYPAAYDPAAAYAAYPPAAPYNYSYPPPPQQQGYAPSGYGHAPYPAAPYPAAPYAAQQGYADPHYGGAYGYPAASPAPGSYYPPPAQGYEYAQPPAGYSYPPATEASSVHGAPPPHAAHQYPYQAPYQQHK